jgi:hypothetical protein
LALTDEAVGWVARNRAWLIPDVSSQQIMDKSKSGGLGKFLTCWQATYFCAQCVFRLSRQLPISLLELNVVAHALCALVLFWLWWDKPQDVQEPTLITYNDGLDLCAYLSLKTNAREVPVTREFMNELWPIGPASTWIPCKPCLDAWEVTKPTAVKLYRQRKPSGCHVKPVAIALYSPRVGDSPDHLRPLFGPYRQPCLKVLGTFWTIGTWNCSWRDGETCELDSRCIRRLARAYGYVEDDNDVLRRTSVVDRCMDLDWVWLDYLLINMVDIFLLHETSFSSAARRHLLWAAAGLTLAGACYGGLHLTAWTCQFPSHTETLLWRAASVTIATTGPSFIAYALCRSLINLIHDCWQKRSRARVPGKTKDAFTRFALAAESTADLLLVKLWRVWYILCRAFIVVECFIMLAHLPDTALKIPSWAAYVPHIT